MAVNLAAVAIIGVAAMSALRSTLHACQTAAPPATATSAAPSARSVWDGVYTEEQVKRGASVYRQSCSSCHGDALEGGESAGPLAGAVFTANWNGVTVGDLFERTRVSMPLDRPGTLSRQQNADVLAYLFSANRFPAGKTELARLPELLKQIRFEATKPSHD